jgi:hypothetical protein
MSRTMRATVTPGADWWSKRANPDRMSAHSRKPGTMKWFKRRLHKVERRAGRVDCRL